MWTCNVSYGSASYAGTYSSSHCNVGRVVSVMRANYICRMADWRDSK